MPLPKLSVTGLDNENQRRRLPETINGILTHQFDDSRVQTAAEKLAGVSVVNYAYAPGNPLRYGANTTPGTTDMTPAIKAAIDQCQNTGGAPVFFTHPGPYACGSIDVTGGCEIYGNNAVIQMTASGSSAVYFLRFTVSLSGFVCRDLIVIGSGNESDNQYCFGPQTSSVVVSDARFENVTMYNCVVGLDASAMNNLTVTGGTIGPTFGNASGKGYGIVGGTNSRNISVNGVRFYRVTRHSCYVGATQGATVTGCVFDQHGFGQTPGQTGALVMARGYSQVAAGNTFTNCVHNPVEIADDSDVSGQYEGWTFTGNVFRGCKRALIVGLDSASVGADQSTVAGSITGNTWHMPSGSDGICIRIFQADTMVISGNTFYFPNENIDVLPVIIDDVATDYPKNVLVSGNVARINTSGTTKALVFIDTGVCGSTSAASVEIRGNRVGGGAPLWASASDLQNANVITDTRTSKVIQSGATPYICGYTQIILDYSGATNITNFLGGHDGQILYLYWTNGNATLVSGSSTIRLRGAANFTGSQYDAMILKMVDGAWTQQAYESVN